MKWIHPWLKIIILVSVIFCSQGFPHNNTTEQECSSDNDCVTDKICIDLKCVDLCVGVCSRPNTVCVVQDLQPICSCKPGYEGHPFTECKPGTSLECTQNAQCPQDKACLNNRCVDPCQGSCGFNTECRVVNHRHVCACKSGFFYNTEAGCLPISVPECQTNSHCVDNLACRKQKCVDPCEGICGNNTVCSVKNHHAACACSPGFSGDAFDGCKPQCIDENRPREKKRFIIIEEKVDWFSAVRECHSRGMYLASINSEDEANDLNQLFLSKGSDELLWLGAHDLGVYRDFVWITAGRGVTYTNWSANEPNGESYHCLSISSSSFKWTSRLCISDKYSFVCETNY